MAKRRKLAELEYGKMKDFLSFYAQQYLHLEDLPPEAHPIAFLEALEKKSMAMARKGLREAINDCIEMSSHFDHAEVEKLDSGLRSRGIVTLTELRRQHWKDCSEILERGRIKSEAEYDCS